MIYFAFDLDYKYSSNISFGIECCIEVCAEQIISYIVHNTFVVKSESQIINFDEPVMLIDCLRSEQQKLKLEKYSDEALAKCNRMIKIIEKNIARDSTDDDLKQVPFVIDNVDTLSKSYDRDRKLSSKLDIRNFHNVAVCRWEQNDTYIVHSFYQDLLDHHLRVKNYDTKTRGTKHCEREFS
jgi:hypothetical protein